jgi:hypothetical protein
MDHLQCVKCKSSISNELREKLICGCFICSKCIHHLQSINVKRVFCPFCNAHHNIGKYIKELSYAKSDTVVLEQEDPFLNLEIDVLNEARTDDDDDLFQICDELQNENESWFQCFKADLNSSSLGGNFKIVHLNINSICLKLANVETLLNSRIVDILVLQETKVDCSVPNYLI